jgi:hypothetical protein
MSNILDLRQIDRKRLDQLQERTTTALSHEDIWYIHVVLAQCFLPYRDPKTRDWTRQNGVFSIFLTAGLLRDPHCPAETRVAGLPYGAKPRLFQSYVCTQAIKQKSPVIPVERSMTAMMRELGLGNSGGKEGTIKAFKEQTTRFASCHFTIVGPGQRGGDTYIKAAPIRKFDVWFPGNADQEMLWPSEIVLTDEYYDSLRDHAIPYDFRALKAIQNKPRSQDIYLWMTQRLCRLSHNKPLLMKWKDLYEMFGGISPLGAFKRDFPTDLTAALTSYPDARLERHKEGYLFHASPPPIPKTKLIVKQ